MSDSREIMDIRSDPYARAAASASTGGIYLSFNRVGNFVAGQDKTKIPIGTRLIANMPGLRDGWRRWFGGRVEDDQTELVITGFEPPPRSQQGYLDKDLWERDNKGVPRDPVQLTYVLDLSDDDGQIYTFTTASKTGRNSFKRFMGKYATEYRMRPNMLPIITLGRESYEHREFGEMYFPVLEIVGWTDADHPSTKDANQAQMALEPPASGQRAANPTETAVVAARQASQTTSQTRFPSEVAGEYREVATTKAEAKQDLHAAGRRPTRF